MYELCNAFQSPYETYAYHGSIKNKEEISPRDLSKHIPVSYAGPERSRI